MNEKYNLNIFERCSKIYLEIKVAENILDLINKIFYNCSWDLRKTK